MHHAFTHSWNTPFSKYSNKIASLYLQPGHWTSLLFQGSGWHCGQVSWGAARPFRPVIHQGRELPVGHWSSALRSVACLVSALSALRGRFSPWSWVVPTVFRTRIYLSRIPFLCVNGMAVLLKCKSAMCVWKWILMSEWWKKTEEEAKGVAPLKLTLEIYETSVLIKEDIWGLIECSVFLL